MTDVLVSVLINNYNYGRFLSDAIDSALNQTYTNIEIIVVDDGSTDNSREVISEYGTQITTILKENGGQASAFNAGFARCRGDIICFLDSDDTWYENKIERIVDALKTAGTPTWSMLRHNLTDSRCFHAPSTSSSPLKLIPDIRTELKIEHIDRRDVLTCRRNAPTTSICAPRLALSRIMPVPEAEFRISADAYLYTHLPAVGPVISISDSLGMYRIHGQNAYYSQHRTKESIIKTLQLEFALLDGLPVDTRYHDDILRLSHFIKRHDPRYLQKLGGLPERLYRICGSVRHALGRFDLIKRVLKELVRSMKPYGSRGLKIHQREQS